MEGCHTYTLGWHVCDYDGAEIHMHGGNYLGQASYMSYSSELGAGIAVFANSNRETGRLTRGLVEQYYDYLLDVEDAEENAQTRINTLEARLQTLETNTVQANAERIAEPYWGGWTWEPDHAVLQEYVGEYSGFPGIKPAVVEFAGDQLQLRWGAVVLGLTPAQPDLFGGKSDPADTADQIRFNRDEAGEIISASWDEQIQFQRLD